jgi:CheY-like chemotaxis protein
LAWPRSRDKIPGCMSSESVLLVVDNGELRARYELILRFCGYDPVAVSSRAAIETVPVDVAAAVLLTDHSRNLEAICRKLLDAAVPVVRIDPFIRHAREHLPFDVVLPASSEPRQLIAALRHLRPHGAAPS